MGRESQIRFDSCRAMSCSFFVYSQRSAIQKKVLLHDRLSTTECIYRQLLCLWFMLGVVTILKNPNIIDLYILLNY